VKCREVPAAESRVVSLNDNLRPTGTVMGINSVTEDRCAMAKAFAHHVSVRAHKPYCCRKGIVAPAEARS
jgi:hypothetical protein